jgi:hypothetical protein
MKVNGRYRIIYGMESCALLLLWPLWVMQTFTQILTFEGFLKLLIVFRRFYGQLNDIFSNIKP